jgi:hypothetical protein
MTATCLVHCTMISSTSNGSSYFSHCRKLNRPLEFRRGEELERCPRDVCIKIHYLAQRTERLAILEVTCFQFLCVPSCHSHVHGTACRIYLHVRSVRVCLSVCLSPLFPSTANSAHILVLEPVSQSHETFLLPIAQYNSRLSRVTPLLNEAPRHEDEWGHRDKPSRDWTTGRNWCTNVYNTLSSKH